MERGLPGFCPISRTGLSGAASYGPSGADFFLLNFEFSCVVFFLDDMIRLCEAFSDVK